MDNKTDFDDIDNKISFALTGPEIEFEEYDSKRSWETVYQKINHEASMKYEFTCKDARRPENKGKNRYRDVHPYDHSRVKLERDNIDFINANLIQAPDANRSYILTQGPLPSTSGHFWLMVWEQNSRAVLMLNRVIEKGQVKCHQYFPTGEENEGENEMIFDDVGLKVVFISESNANYFTVRTLQLEDIKSGETKEVLQFHYTTWPDFGVPSSPGAFLNFLMAVRSSGALEQNVGPAVIHCSAGIGRSGTFCLVDTCLVLVENSRNLNSIDIKNILLDMRQYRVGLIQRPEQLRFSYLAIIEGAKRVLSSSPDSGFGDTTELQDVEEGPPQPPQRSTSLENGRTSRKRRITEEIEEDSSDEEGSPPPVPPRPPPHKNDLNETCNNAEDDNGNDPSKDKQSGSELRRRKREDRIKNTTAQIEKMKKKQREAEFWKNTKSQIQPYLIGLSVTFAIGSYLLYRYYFSE